MKYSAVNDEWDNIRFWQKKLLKIVTSAHVIRAHDLTIGALNCVQ